MLLLDRGDHRLAAAAGQVHVEQHHVGEEPPDDVDGGPDVLGLADHFDVAAKFGSNTGAEQPVVVD